MTSTARVDRLDTVIAFMVATISIISAVVAGRAAVWSSAASDIDSIVFQEAIEARQLESDLDIAAASDLRLAARYDAAAQRQLIIGEEALERWETDPQAAARLDLAAQAEWEVDLALWRFFRMSVPAYDADGRLVFDVQRSIAAQRAADARLTELGRSPTPARAEEARSRAIALVAVAVLFVAALFVLTVAEVWPGRRRWAPLLVGVSIALIAAAATIVVDPDTAMLVAAIVVAAVIVLLAAIGLPARRRRLAARAASTPVDDPEVVATAQGASGDGRSEDAPAEVQPAVSEAASEAAASVPIDGATAPIDGATAPIDGATSPDEHRGPLRTAVVVVLAAATLLGAAVAYLQSASSDAGAAATNQAQQQALLALTEHQRTAARASADLEVWSLVEEHRARAAGARQLARYLAGIGEVDAAAEATADAARWDRAATEADALTLLSDDHPDGPSADPRFPARFLARQVEARSARVARQDLANEAAAGWGARGAAYVAVLATIAIAAYLLGLSLILRREGLRRLFAIVGVGLVAAAGVAAAATALERDKTPDLAEQEAIARAFARGRVAAEAARAPAERSAAVDAYREVVAMHPTLARAHVELASALFDESSPQSSGYLSVATIEAVEAALAELEAARDLGWDDLETRGNLGFYQMLVGLARPTTDLTDDAVANNASALELGPELPVLRYNLAAALLADGQADAARSAYAEAIAATVAREADGEPRFTDAERAGVVAGAITDLELIAAARPDDPGMEAAAAEITSAIVAGTGDPIPADRAGAPVTVSGLELLADPASLWWQADIEGLDPERDSVSVLWLVEDPAVPGWHVLPNHSGPLRLGGWTTAGEFHVDGAAPAYWASQSHLLASDPRRCVPDGRYRLELFVNGRRAAGPLVETLDMPELVSEARPDLGVLFCRPADWERGTDLRGDSVRFTRADGTPAMVVTRVHRPNPPDDADAGEVVDVLDAVAASWPGNPTRAPGIEPVDAYLMGLEDAAVMWYEGAGGTLKVFGGATGQGTVLAVGVAGTAEWVDSDEASDIVGSFVLQ